MGHRPLSDYDPRGNETVKKPAKQAIENVLLRVLIGMGPKAADGVSLGCRANGGQLASTHFRESGRASG